MGKRNRGGVAPIYSVALLWLLWGFFLPLYSIIEYVPLIIAATVLYNVVKGATRNTSNETETTKTVSTPAKEVKEVMAAKEVIREALTLLQVNIL